MFERLVGIDLGTTNSLVAYMQGDIPAVIPGEDGVNLVPSVVALDENNQPIIGNAARRHLIETPERAVYSVKRLMGRGVEDVQDELKLFPFRLADDLQPGEVFPDIADSRHATPIKACISPDLGVSQPLRLLSACCPETAPLRLWSFDRRIYGKIRLSNSFCLKS